MAPLLPEVRELTGSREDLELVRTFYTDLCVPEFPDADERESLVNIERYLALKTSGWYGLNNYHVRVLLQNGRPIGGAIADYLAGPNTGVIEFLVVAPSMRGRGLGHRLLEDMEATLESDAQAAGLKGLSAIAAEMNDPYRRAMADDSMDPFVRLLIWSDWGYRKLDFAYVQPRLSPGRNPVTSLLLAWKPRVVPPGDAVPARMIKHMLHEYIRWAMRIEHPEQSPEFALMASQLDARDRVELVPLDGYVGHDPARCLVVREIVAADDPDLPATRELYRAYFNDAATAVEAPMLGAVAGGRTARADEYACHLWALRASSDGPVAGLVSFFTFPGAGFGGYVALAPPLRGTDRLPLVLARVEAQMVRDGLAASGWYVECDDRVVVVFRRAGFHEVAVTYRQPSLRPGGSTPELHLLYKAFGRTSEVPMLKREVFLDAVRRIYCGVYAIDRPEDEPLYRELAQQVSGSPLVPLR